MAELERSWPRRSAPGARTSPPGDPRARRGPGQARCSTGWRAGFPEAYKEDYPPRARCDDLRPMLDAARRGLGSRVRLVEHPERWRLKVYRSGTPAHALGRAAAAQHMGVEVVDERPYELTGSSTAAVLDLRLRPAPAGGRPRPAARELFQDALTALWQGADRERRVQRAGARRAA